ncbi:MAG: hypothetical protein AAF696_18730 [Bacteroidota bacterium]
MTGVEEADAKIKRLIDEKWNFNEVRYINPRIRKFHEGDEFSFSVLELDNTEITDEVTTTYADGSVSQSTSGYYGHKSLSLFFIADKESTRMSNIIATVPIDCWLYKSGKSEGECNADQIAYKYDILINQLIETVNFTKKHSYSPTLAHVTGYHKYAKAYNKRAKAHFELKEKKTLLIYEGIFNKKYTSSDFSKNYKFPHKIVDRSEYESIILEASEDYLILLKGQAPKAILSVYDLQKKETLFMDVNYNAVGNYWREIRVNKGQVSRLNKHMASILP